MPEIPRYLIDASVAIKWHLSDEEFVGLADQVRVDFERGSIRLLAPEQIRHEVASAVLKATRHPTRPKRLLLEEGQHILQMFLGWDIELIDHEALIPAAFDFAAYYGCS